MVTVDQAVIARCAKEGKHFEVLVDPDIAYDLKEGKTVSLSRMLATNMVFTDARKAVKASPADVAKAFGSHDPEQIAEEIVKKGDVQLTTDFRRKKTEERRKQIAGIISKYAINPQTKLPHPPDRILNAMGQARVNIDPFKPAEQQAEDIIKALKPILPISVEQLTVTAEIPAQYAGRAYGIVKDLGELKDQQWLGSGALIIKLVFPAGLRESVYRKLNAVTDGNARISEEAKK
ncbi:MAG: ribosome assembly factor SBDS [Candidatus Aenigmarchaeota archaeon]|nr:ribosome assembly factor SBDS [Candidatus Aenigmarchaeota archaeon]